MFKKINPFSKSIVTFCLWLTALLLSACIPVAGLSGSYRYVLSGINIVLPIAGGLFSFGSIGLLIGALWLLKIFFLSLPITIGIPSACAMLSWASTRQGSKQKMLNFAINALLPAMCMAVFMLHPTAQAACTYALYWLIPIVIYMVNRTNNSLLLALQSTFVAHAVGSIMWLFLIPMTAAQWLALIPVVALERLSIAVLAAGLFTIIRMASSLITATQGQLHKENEL